MATSIDWVTGVITVPRADMTLIQTNPSEIRELDTNVWRLELRDLEDDIAGRPWPRTHDHNADVTVGGVTLADVLIILAPYTVTFENGLYAVNIVGTNNNVLDRNNKNQVSVNTSNSAGLIVTTGGGGATAQEVWEYLIAGSGDEQAQAVLLDAFKKARLAANKL